MPLPLPMRQRDPDTHHGIAETLLTGHHSCRQCDVGADHGLLADVDVVLVEDGVGRKADDASCSEPAETAPGSGVGPDRPHPAEPRPRAAHSLTTDAVADGSGPVSEVRRHAGEPIG